MVSVVSSSLVCLLCVILFPVVWADYCRGYWDTDGRYYGIQQCGIQYCCGNCNSRYCCSEKQHRLTQELCESSLRSSYTKKSNIAVLVGSIIGSIFPIILCVSVIICCVAPCCLCYKKCRKGRNTSRVVMTTMTPANTPQQPVLPSGYQPSYPVYQSVPVQPGYGGLIMPTAPTPSYQEAEAHPAYSPGVFPPGQPTYPFQPQPYTLPPHSDELAQPPYNPSYGLNPLNG